MNEKNILNKYNSYILLISKRNNKIIRRTKLSPLYLILCPFNILNEFNGACLLVKYFRNEKTKINGLEINFLKPFVSKKIAYSNVINAKFNSFIKTSILIYYNQMTYSFIFR